MNWQELTHDQESLKNNILQQSKELPSVITSRNILNRVKNYSKNELNHTFGEFGLRLKEFAENIDLTHPGLLKLYHGQFYEEKDGSFNKDASDLLKLTSYALNSNSSHHIIFYLKKIIKKHALWNELNNNIDNPFQNKRHIRFVESRSKRDLIRSTEKMHEINLDIILKRDLINWQNHIDCFKEFYRFESKFKEELNFAKGRYTHFQNLGLSAMASKIKKTISDLELKNEKHTYFGFNKITYSQIAVILAKQMGFKFTETYVKKIEIDPSKYPHPHPHNYKLFFYSPRAYSIYDYEINTIIPQSVLEIINYLEEFPELNGKSAFDTYKVIVPGVNYPSGLEPSPFKVIRNNKINWVDNIKKVYQYYDIDLLREKIPAIVVGEKDKETFFICYWA